MDARKALAQLWKKSKMGLFNSVTSISLTFLLGVLKLGRRARPILKQFEKKVRKPWIPTAEELEKLEFFGTMAINAFKLDSVEKTQAAYPDFDEHYVASYRDQTVFVIGKENQYCIGFRGSETEQNWVDNFTATIAENEELKISIHKGYNELAKGMADKLTSILPRDANLHITGGSLGGVISVAVGWLLDERGFNVEEIWDFAGPKFTDADYSHLNVIHIQNAQDPVPYLPLCLSPDMCYRHQDTRIVFKPAGEEYGANWYIYNDSDTTDVLLSALFNDQGIDVQQHKKYGHYLQQFIAEQRAK